MFTTEERVFDLVQSIMATPVACAADTLFSALIFTKSRTIGWLPKKNTTHLNNYTIVIPLYQRLCCRFSVIKCVLFKAE